MRDALLGAGFTADGLLVELGAPAYAGLSRGDHLAARRALADRDDALGVLTRLFVLGDPVASATVADRLPLEALVDLGLLEPAGGTSALRAALDVRPYGEADTDWFVVSDHGPDTAGGLGSAAHHAAEVAADHVLGVGGASLTLAQIVPRAPVRAALDVGTGSGVQALHLSRHAQRVVATDTNARALRLAELTAGLSGQQWELRRGSMLEPVSGEAFDLVVSNPPFVVSPGQRYAYRDAGLPGDSLGASLVSQLPAHLAEDGTAVVLANWLHTRGEDWRERVAGWVEATGCDAWIAQREVQDPSEYASLWLRDAGVVDEAELQARYDEWVADLAAQDVEAIGFGWVVLHKGGARGAGGPRVEDVADAVRLPRGDEVAALVAARAGLAVTDAFALLGSAACLAEGVELVDSQLVATGGGLGPGVPRVRSVSGWRQPTLLDPLLLRALQGLDGHSTVAQALSAAADAFDVDHGDAIAAGLVTLRPLVEDGLLRL